MVLQQQDIGGRIGRAFGEGYFQPDEALSIAQKRALLREEEERNRAAVNDLNSRYSLSPEPLDPNYRPSELENTLRSLPAPQEGEGSLRNTLYPREPSPRYQRLHPSEMRQQQDPQEIAQRQAPAQERVPRPLRYLDPAQLKAEYDKYGAGPEGESVALTNNVSEIWRGVREGLLDEAQAKAEVARKVPHRAMAKSLNDAIDSRFAPSKLKEKLNIEAEAKEMASVKEQTGKDIKTHQDELQNARTLKLYADKLENKSSLKRGLGQIAMKLPDDPTWGFLKEQLSDPERIQLAALGVQQLRGYKEIFPRGITDKDLTLLSQKIVTGSETPEVLQAKINFKYLDAQRELEIDKAVNKMARDGTWSPEKAAEKTQEINDKWWPAYKKEIYAVHDPDLKKSVMAFHHKHPQAVVMYKGSVVKGFEPTNQESIEKAINAGYQIWEPET